MESRRPEFIVAAAGKNTEKLALAKEFRKKATPAEAKLWEAVRGKSVGGLHFRRQQVIQGFIVDFYCHSARLVVEIDGPIHDNQRDYDKARESIFAALGLRVLRFTNDQVQGDISAVLATIATTAK